MKAPCQKCYKWFDVNSLKLENRKFLCSKCVKKIRLVKERLKSLPDGKSIKIVFSYELCSSDWGMTDDEFNGEEKVEILINDMKAHFNNMTFLDFIECCKIEVF